MKILLGIVLIILSSCGSKKNSETNSVLDNSKMDFSLLPQMSQSIGDQELLLQSAPLIHEIKDVETFIGDFNQTYEKALAAKENGDLSLIESEIDHVKDMENFCIAHQDIVWGLHELEIAGSDSCFLKQIKNYVEHKQTTYEISIPESGNADVSVNEIFSKPGVRYIYTSDQPIIRTFVRPRYSVTVLPKIEERDRYLGGIIDDEHYWPAGYSNKFLKILGENKFTSDYRVMITRFETNDDQCIGDYSNQNPWVEIDENNLVYQPMHMRYCSLMPNKIEFINVAQDGSFYIKSVIRNGSSTNWVWTFHTGRLKEGNGGYLVYDHDYDKTFHISSNHNHFSKENDTVKLTSQEQITLSMQILQNNMLTKVKSHNRYRIGKEWRFDQYQTQSNINYTGSSFRDFQLLNGSGTGSGSMHVSGMNINWESSGSFIHGFPYTLSNQLNLEIPQSLEVPFSEFEFPMTINLFPWHNGSIPNLDEDYSSLPDWIEKDIRSAFLDPDPTWVDLPDNIYIIKNDPKVNEIKNECTAPVVRPRKVCGELYQKRKILEDLLK